MKIVTPLEISIIGGETYKCNLNLVCKHPNIKFSKKHFDFGKIITGDEKV